MDCEDAQRKEGMLDRIDVEIELTGPLTAENSTPKVDGGRCEMPRFIERLRRKINIRLRALLSRM